MKFPIQREAQKIKRSFARMRNSKALPRNNLYYFEPFWKQNRIDKTVPPTLSWGDIIIYPCKHTHTHQIHTCGLLHRSAFFSVSLSLCSVTHTHMNEQLWIRATMWPALDKTNTVCRSAKRTWVEIKECVCIAMAGLGCASLFAVQCDVGAGTFSDNYNDGAARLGVVCILWIYCTVYSAHQSRPSRMGNELWRAMNKKVNNGQMWSKYTQCVCVFLVNFLPLQSTCTTNDDTKQFVLM